MNSDRRRFQKGSGVYTCRICKKKTRETGEGESNTDLCYRCYTIAGIENEHLNGYHRFIEDKDCPLCQPPSVTT
jgi:hypothetical protein